MNLDYILNPPANLSLEVVILIAFILGLLHGATPDEHTWPITFSYAIGQYSTKKGMKAGLVFSGGFTLQRALLTTLGFLGLAAIYMKYNLDGPVYIAVGIGMFVAGSYILKGRYLHIPLDVLLRGRQHHSAEAKRAPLHETEAKEVPIKLAFMHGLIAGWGFGIYAAIVTFILAPEMRSIWLAPLPGLFFGLGTMVMQIVFGAVFANLAKLKKIPERLVEKLGRTVAGKTLYYGGIAFAIIGSLIVAFPFIDNLAVSTGNPIPNLSSIDVATVLVLLVVGVIGMGSLIYGFREMGKMQRD
ncbi:MAG: hypothetical protein QXP70_04100 [Methanomassiliicoccales archaeon]